MSPPVENTPHQCENGPPTISPGCLKESEERGHRRLAPFRPKFHPAALGNREKRGIRGEKGGRKGGGSKSTISPLALKIGTIQKGFPGNGPPPPNSPGCFEESETRGNRQKKRKSENLAISSGCFSGSGKEGDSEKGAIQPGAPEPKKGPLYSLKKRIVRGILAPEFLGKKGASEGGTFSPPISSVYFGESGKKGEFGKNGESEKMGGRERATQTFSVSFQA